MYIDEIRPQIAGVPLSEQVATLARYCSPLRRWRARSSLSTRFVSEKMGGTIPSGDVATFGFEVAMHQLKTELRSNILPIGRVRKGVHAQRAFLFKVETTERCETTPLESF